LTEEQGFIVNRAEHWFCLVCVCVCVCVSLCVCV
jgi:hypothetical protein